MLKRFALYNLKDWISRREHVKRCAKWKRKQNNCLIKIKKITKISLHTNSLLNYGEFFFKFIAVYAKYEMKVIFLLK